ncbi:hypothetical protein CEUSTIGMA_g6674.t1 [Chlamydomonas eustigma]|uniref:RRM domain-containing protein n=1 Tax=Chlamydomonas eustigma TaxID=1157962 RepID=A0A250X832_9CHLO|nr:hypothetical protein CEUSTIGMA_g6674.t1 [Chlamydomonas eustigma]|eukprot:GAX79234.1 hypothetical protein CEUSTIGMA_g6674.t1 [Chlamydomonas eustigma]
MFNSMMYSEGAEGTYMSTELQNQGVPTGVIMTNENSAYHTGASSSMPPTVNAMGSMHLGELPPLPVGSTYIGGPQYSWVAGVPGMGLVHRADGGAPSGNMISMSGAMHNMTHIPQVMTRTIFVTGFPMDVRERELHNLLRFIPGYEASQMHDRGGSPQGFALFDSTGHAWGALELITQLQFDNNVHLRCEMAHKDMYLKEGDPSIRRAVPLPQHLMAYLHNPAATAAAAASSVAPQAVVSSGNPGGSVTVLPAGSMGMQLGSFTMGGRGNMLGTLMAGPTSVPPRMAFHHVNKGDQPPCNTLFIGNLSDHVAEEELLALFQVQPGFKQLKLVRGPKQVSCFVEFEDTVTASSSHSRLQGALLSSSDRGGIRVQFSKNPYGTRSPMNLAPAANFNLGVAPPPC